LILEGVNMKGGYYFDRRRQRYRVYFPWKGKRLWFNHYGANRIPLYNEELAKRVLAQIQSEVDGKTFDPINWGKDKTILVPNAWKIYQEQNPVGRVRMGDRDRIFEDFIKPYFKDMTLADIEEHHVLDWFSKLPKTYSPAYLRLIRVTLRAFLNAFQISRKKMMRFPKITVPKKKLEWLVEEEQTKVVEAALPHHRPILRFLTTYGCRVSEACNLQRTDIDWQKREITFRGRKNMEDNVLPIMPEIEKDLVGGGVQCENAGKLKISGSLPPDRITTGTSRGGSCPPINLHYVFSTSHGLKYTRSAVYGIWVRASKKAGVRVIPLKNGTRTSLACRLKNRGTATADIARILGNSEQVVEESYARVTTQRAAEILQMRKGKEG
jgi:integrase